MPSAAHRSGSIGSLPGPWLDPADRREPAAAAPQVVERQAQGDRVQPGADVRAVEPVPRAVGLEVCLLRDVLGVALVAEDEDEPPDEVRVVRPDGRLERVRVALRGGGAIARAAAVDVGRRSWHRVPEAVADAGRAVALVGDHDHGPVGLDRARDRRSRAPAVSPGGPSIELPLPPSGASIVPVSTCQSTSVKPCAARKACGLAAGSCTPCARRPAAGPGSGCPGRPRPGWRRRPRRPRRWRRAPGRRIGAAASETANRPRRRRPGRAGRLRRSRARALRAPRAGSRGRGRRSFIGSPSVGRRVRRLPFDLYNTAAGADPCTERRSGANRSAPTCTIGAEGPDGDQ